MVSFALRPAMENSLRELRWKGMATQGEHLQPLGCRVMEQVLKGQAPDTRKPTGQSVPSGLLRRGSWDDREDFKVWAVTSIRVSG